MLSLTANPQAELEQYLAYLGLSKQEPSVAYLNALVKQHVRTIPWENFLWICDKQVLVDPVDLINRYVQGLGGVCYQLNYTFYLLLKYLGFKVTLCPTLLLASRDKIYPSPLPTHLANVVVFQEQLILADVGFLSLEKVLAVNEEHFPFRFVPSSDPNWEFELQYYAHDTWILQFQMNHQAITAQDIENCTNYADAPLERSPAHLLMFGKMLSDETYVIGKNDQLTLYTPEKTETFEIEASPEGILSKVQMLSEHFVE